MALAACDADGNPKRPRSADLPDTVGSERVVLEVPQYLTNHNGGALFFGGDGYLYLGLGDGGGAGDNEDNAQDRTNLLGSIVRIHVEVNTDSAPFYTIPPDNPFAGNADGWREEIFAYGLRNPWRVTYDAPTDRIWAGDVGQNAWEEIDIIEPGKNYGWDCREGLHDYTGPPGTPSAACMGVTGLEDPVFEYPHGGGDVSITGGYVYRGASLPSLAGKYVYADYNSGRVWALAWDGVTATNEDVVDAAFAISSFGVDEAGELYLLQYAASAKIYRIVDAGGGVYQLAQAFPDLTFAHPVDLRHAGDGSGRLFVVEQEGRVVAFDAAAPDTSWTYIDLSGQVACCGELGLLGLAFHPEFAANKYAFVYYTRGTSLSLVGRISRIKTE
jgi:glucose/arabinose dehydrogenase